MTMHMTKEEVVRKVMEKVPKFVKIKLTLMDRWFFADNVFTYLESTGNYFLTPATEYPSIKKLIKDNPKRPCVIEEHSMGECNAKFKVILIEEFQNRDLHKEIFSKTFLYNAFVLSVQFMNFHNFLPEF